MNTKKFYLSVLVGILLITVLGCGGSDSPKNITQIPVNISVFLDLSDRIDSVHEGDIPVSQRMARDTAIVNTFIDYFVNMCVKHKISENRNHFQILFHPTPKTSDIETLAANLNIDMSKISKAADKKKKLIEMKDNFSKGLTLIYEQTLCGKDFVDGSDIWGFFCNKNAKVDDLCIRKGYRNIIVILTDGYIYYKHNMQQEGNSYNYILSSLIDNAPDMSLMAPRTGLDSLEVMMLEINPGKLVRHDKLISVLETWLKDMGVKRYVVSETGKSSDTRTIIDNFLKKE